MPARWRRGAFFWIALMSVSPLDLDQREGVVGQGFAGDATEKAMIDSAISDGPHADATIAITLGRIQQLFNSFDPSPFASRQS
jgi:hypothetical protein